MNFFFLWLRQKKIGERFCQLKAGGMKGFEGKFDSVSRTLFDSRQRIKVSSAFFHVNYVRVLKNFS